MSYSEPSKKYKYDNDIWLWIAEEFEKLPLPTRHEIILPVPMWWLEGLIRADRKRKAAEYHTDFGARWAESEAKGNWPPMKQTVLNRLAKDAEISQ